MSIYEINIVPKRSIVIEPILETLNESVDGYIVYESFSFETDKPESEITRILAWFSVPKSWLNDQTIQNLKLLMFNNNTRSWIDSGPFSKNVSFQNSYDVLIELPKYAKYAIAKEKLYCG